MTAVLAKAPTAADALGLEPEQVQAAILLAAGMPTGKVAEQVGVDRRTLFHWRQRPAFAMAFERELAAQTQLVREVVHARLLGLAERALDVVEVALNAGGAPALAAARVVLARAEPPGLVAMPSAEDFQREMEAARERDVKEQLSRMSDQELCETIQRMREQGEPTRPAQQERFNRMSPAEQSAARNAHAQSAAERVRALRGRELGSIAAEEMRVSGGRVSR